MNWIIGTALVIALITIVFALYCALIVAGQTDDESDSEDYNEGEDEMFWKKKICPRCRTGKESYDLDRHSEACPYIGCWKKGKCSFFEPLDTTPKKGILSGLKNKRSVTPPPPRKIAQRWAFGGVLDANRIRSIS